MWQFSKKANLTHLSFLCILAIITLFVYLPSLQYPFQFDDLPNILNYVKLKTDTLSSLCFSQRRWLVIWLNKLIYDLWDSSSLACRIINLAFHISSGALVFWLIIDFKKKLKDYFQIASLTAILFLLHPVQTQTISYIIQGQSEGLASLLSLICIVAFYKFTQTKKSSTQTLTICLLFISLILATSTKEIAIIIPALILLIDWFWVSNGNIQQIKSRLWLHLLIFISTFGMFLYYLKPDFFINIFCGRQVVFNNTGNLLTLGNGSKITQFQFFISQFKVIIHYLWIFIWPAQICIEYDWPLCQSWWEPSCLIPLFGLLLLGVIIYALLRRNKIHPVAFGLLWFLICTLPRASIIASGELLVDYKTYLASVGWLFVIAYLINLAITKYISIKYQKNYFVLAYLSLMAILCLSTIRRNEVWKSNLNFWGDVICKAPQKARGFNNYGMALIENHEYQKSIFYFKRAIELNCFDSVETFYWDPYQNLANAYALSGEIDQAVEILQKGLKINPQIAELHSNLGALLAHQRKFDYAIAELKFALKLKPTLGEAMYSLGKIYLAIHQPDLAWDVLHTACTTTHQDRSIATLQLYAQASIYLEKFESAIWALKKILKIDPQNEQALLNLAGAYYFCQDHANARDCYQKVIRHNSNNILAKQRLIAISNHATIAK